MDDAVGIVAAVSSGEDAFVSVIEIDELLPESVPAGLLLQVLFTVLVLHLLHLIVQQLQLLANLTDFLLDAVQLLFLLLCVKVRLMAGRRVCPAGALLSLLEDAAELRRAPACDCRLIHIMPWGAGLEQYSNSESAGLGHRLLPFLALHLFLLHYAVLLAQSLRQLYLRILQLLALFGDVKVVRSKREDGWLFGLKPGSVFLVVKGENSAEFLVDEGVIAFLGFGGLDCVNHPLLELEVFGIGSAVESKLKVLLTLPKLLRRQSEHFAVFFRDVLLVFVVIVGVVGLEVGGVAVVIEEKLGEVVVLEGELPGG